MDGREKQCLERRDWDMWSLSILKTWFIWIFFLTLMPKQILSMTPLKKKNQNDPLLFFGDFFFVVFLIPAVSNGRNEPLPDTCQSVTGWNDVTFFLFFVPAIPIGGTDFFIFFLFGNNMYIIKIYAPWFISLVGVWTITSNGVVH